ncbi:hypothetical protein DFH07DRAFT_840015 [Mycena maculata]|uniref:Uncharacterized protein n=1 Tax=Mycena maculata TaxID=230809 RepID=A0AAD7IE08_9AGAR|nr:hypothetical protein DFH07DRAFT_840015 [Mycena maculata]
MPTLLHRYNAPLAFVLLPFLHPIVCGGYDAERGLVDPTAAAVLWVGTTVVLMCSRIATLAFVTNMIIIRNHPPGPNSVGAANGLVGVAVPQSLLHQVCRSACLLIPAHRMPSSVFALSVDNDLLWEYPIWVVVMLSVCLVGCYFSQKMAGIDEKTLRS